MRKKIAGWWLVLACALAAAGCGGPGPARPAEEADVDAALSELGSFTAELLRKVDEARDPSSGVTEAQRLLDERKAGMRERLAAVRRSRKFRESEDVRKRALESEVDNVMRVSGIRTRYLGEAMNDAAFGARVDRLVDGYQELFRE